MLLLCVLQEQQGAVDDACHGEQKRKGEGVGGGVHQFRAHLHSNQTSEWVFLLWWALIRVKLFQGCVAVGVH